MSQSAVTELTWQTLPEGDRLAILALDRPEAANAFSAQMMRELTAHFENLQGLTDVRVVIVKSNGKHFSAGADLNWMKESAALDYDANIQDAGKLTAMFEAMQALPQPTVAAVNGAVYGGAVGLVACADIVVCGAKARFCLSEVKLGLLPAVIVPYLARRIRPASLRRYALTAQVFDAAEAKRIGLSDLVAEGPLPEAVKEQVGLLLQGGPEAQRRLKTLLSRVEVSGAAQGADMAKAIAEARTGQEGQAGLTAFFAKQAPPFVRELASNWGYES